METPMSNFIHSTTEENSYSDPLPIETGLLPVHSFTLGMLPEPLRPWVKDIAYRRQCPLDFVAVPAVLMFASLIGARCSIKSNEKDDWMVVPNLWGGILGDPGTLKSPVCSEVLFPLGYLESRSASDYKEQKNQFEAEKATFNELKGALEGQLRSIVEKNKEESNKNPDDKVSIVQEKLVALMKNLPPETALKRYKVSDTTVEKMHEILAQNPSGVLVFRDELMGFLESWEKKGHESDRSFYLEAWNGDKPYTIDRISRGTVHAKNICVSILGTTQPDKIASYLAKAFTKLDNDGLLQRFQLLVYPDKKTWSHVDDHPDDDAKERIFNICKTIDEMVFTDQGAIETKSFYEDQFIIPYFRFSKEAQKYFQDWIKTLQVKLESNDHPILLQHFSKYRSLMPSLALIFHIVEVADGKREKLVSLQSVQYAAAWCEYLESHARRIYGMALEPSYEAYPRLSKADELLAWMKKQSSSLDQPLKRRFIMRYSKFRSSKELDPLLSDLMQMGYIKQGEKQTFWVC